MKSLAQLQSERLNAAFHRRHVGGVSPRELREAVSMEKLADWFDTVYGQIDDRIDRAKSGNETEVETELRNFRAILRDYEPRAGMDGEEATHRLSELHTAIRSFPEEYAGTFRTYIQKIVDEVDKAAKAGVESADMELPGEEELGGEEPETGMPGLLGGIGELGGEEEEPETGEAIPGTEGAVETGEEITI